LLQKFWADDIYKAEETDMFYGARADGALSYKYTTLYASKKAIYRVNVLCCSKMPAKGSCWLLRKPISFDALKGLEWTIYQFCTTITRMRG
jgi:hypothetical protein